MVNTQEISDMYLLSLSPCAYHSRPEYDEHDTCEDVLY